MHRAPRRRSAGPAAPVTEEESRAERRARALEEPLDLKPRKGVPYLAFDVRNPARKTRYLGLLPSFPSREGALCTCTDFARRGIGTCKHLEAVWIWLEEHPEVRPEGPFPSSAVAWEEIDRRLGGVGLSPSTPAAARIRRPGAALFDFHD